ncbi:ferritin-like metal-binding protein YciE [Hasllibacter halocynthiae]|uniref:Ferritin-like metal-binding protein YciE n=1 Tax=Hasllibacter halocynthiae TaxID=595589 RepID=A0A2T0X4F4_9RHOB|nr:DUF892 family protein [Hasllibacter halocynthiae]PRY93744.1 ferritin-like metal-binding protein YciE [Hasllibacter halocynthiae]
MALNDLKDVYTDQLADLWSACSQSREATMALSGAASDQDLKDALDAGAEGILAGMDAIKDLAARHGFDPESEHCKGMEGLVREARDHAVEAEFGSDAARDAMIISQYQRMAHYAIAGWGCCKAFASRLGLGEDARTLDECLSNTYDGDDRMTDIATGKDGVNADAVA